MKVTRNGDIGRTERNKLAGAGGRHGDDAGVKNGVHGQASADAGAARRERGRLGARSEERTLPPVMQSMRPATRSDVPEARNRSLRTISAEIPPIRSAIPASSTPSIRIQSRSNMSGLYPEATSAPTVLPAALLADALAVLVVDLLAVIPGHKGLATRERLANRLHGRGVTPGGNEAAVLLGAVAVTLMRMEG